MGLNQRLVCDAFDLPPLGGFNDCGPMRHADRHPHLHHVAVVDLCEAEVTAKLGWGGPLGDDLLNGAHTECLQNVATQINPLRSNFLATERRMDTKGKRLKWARSEAGFRSARAAALAMGMAVPTYNSHERAGEPGAREYDEEDAARYGRRFKVSASWLLFGEGRATRATTIDIVGFVGLGDEIKWGDQNDMSLGEIELPYPLPEGCFALESKGTSQHPRVQNGEVVIARWHEGSPIPYVGSEVVLLTGDGTYLLKTLKRHEGDGHFTIGSHNAPDREGVEVAKVAEVMSIVPARQWKRIR